MFGEKAKHQPTFIQLCHVGCFLVLTYFPSTNTLSTQGIPHQYPEAMERSFGKCPASPTHGRVYVSWRDAKTKMQKQFWAGLETLLENPPDAGWQRGRPWILNPNEAAQLMDCSEPRQKDLKKRKVSLYMCFWIFTFLFISGVCYIYEYMIFSQYWLV